jgi:hypothetical protein
MRISLSVALIIVSGWLPPKSQGALAARSEAAIMEQKEDRRAIMARARIWAPTDIPSKNLLVGPTDYKPFAFDELVTCTSLAQKLTGKTPKFACHIDPDDDVRVKIGLNNGELHAEVAGTRLLWALGFGADRVYPVHVVCRGCEAKSGRPVGKPSDGTIDFSRATIERRLAGQDLTPDGWSWRDLDKLDESASGATRAERDALKLLAVFLQHSDSKPVQQRIICPEGPNSVTDTASACEHPLMYIDDLGVTFGRANWWNAGDIGSMNLAEWSRTPVWKNPKRCIGNIPQSATGTLNNPEIGEDGRQFLANLLTQLSDDQLHQLFEVARVQARLRNPKDESSGFATIEEWVAAFKAKREQIVTTHCSGT